MNPTFKKHAFFAVPFLCALALWNCGNDSTDTGAALTGETPVNVALRLQYDAPPLLDSLVLDCYGVDTLHLVHSADAPSFNMDLFPSDSWKFKASIYANGALMQVGEIETGLTAGTAANLSIQMHPVVGFVYIEIPTGLKNDAGIAGGSLKLKSKSGQHEIALTQTAESAVFKSGMLPLGEEYEMELLLFNEDGKAIYRISDKFIISEDSPVPELTLNSLRSQVSLDVKTADERLIEITLPLQAGYRKPKSDDLLITEIFTNPNKSDSSQYEFVEIFNGTIDTLILDDCQIGITSSGSLKFMPLTVSEIAPMQALVVGDAHHPNTPPLYVNTENWYDIVGSKGSAVLRCDGETIDSLYYAPDADSLHQNVVPSAGNKNGISAQLNIERWKDRSDSTAWCLGKPSPGAVKFCE